MHGLLCTACVDSSLYFTVLAAVETIFWQLKQITLKELFGLSNHYLGFKSLGCSLDTMMHQVQEHSRIIIMFIPALHDDVFS